MIALDSAGFAYDDGAPVLAGVALTVAAGDYVVVAGASGSGKTTLARLLAGMTGADAGSAFNGAITLGAETVRFRGLPDDPRIDPARWSARVAYVAQGAWGQLSMMSSTVAEEIAFGPANRGMPAQELRRAVDDVAAALKITPLLGRDPRRLSGGQLQRTIIAAAVIQRPEVLVLDEPFQGLDDDATQDVAEALEALRRTGTGVVVCAPMLPRHAPRGARVLALADGHSVFDGPLPEARRAGLRRFGIGTEGEPLRRGDDDASLPVDPAGPESIAIRGLGFRYPREPGTAVPPVGLAGVDLSVQAGEVVALRGPNGSGKSTLLHHLNGLSRADSGSVAVGGVRIDRQPTGALAATVGYLFQDTDQQLFERTVLREVSYGPRATGLRKADAARRAAIALDAVGLGALADAHPYELGFVQRRMVALASLIATGPAVWALDEPTAGLDGPARHLLAAVLSRHTRDGGCVLMATHDAAFADAVAHRSVWLDGGRISPDGAPRRGASAGPAQPLG
ncbi:ABC transporter ATP-binding protein [Arthrobacter sp. SX1312]|uniref:ABC transporter ATP-binding protein n=1 Tax=Arthrobacter sp. SX1312 TaxID=2058896 RepID=UPI000CE36D7B|nr:ABC transporter ATP-binding protein [Arthrobacter sp. SX1312]